MSTLRSLSIEAMPFRFLINCRTVILNEAKESRGRMSPPAWRSVASLRMTGFWIYHEIKGVAFRERG
jgi:hypothetical protein